jgi:radical SAM superfamily enzyme YgiQ (UPF0313 family)
MGFLAEAGFVPSAIDLAIAPLDEAAVARARFVGIAVPMHTALRLGVEAARRVRALNPSAHVGFYGLYAPLNREYLERERLADSIIGGEFERELVHLVEALEAGRTPRPRAMVLDKLAFAVPDRRALPALKRYAHLLSPTGERVAGYVEASRGCLHQCRHCPIPPAYDGRFFVVQAEVVLEDIRRQIADGARHITFGDPDFLNGPEHALRLVRALHAEHPDITFDVTTKVEHILQHRTRFAELGRLGCVFVVSAVESLSPRVLEVLDKGHTRADVDVAIDITRDAGIVLRPSLVPFTPWETLESYHELLDWLERRDLLDQIDPIHLAIRLLIPPGSKLLERDETRAVLGALEPDRLTYAWTHPDPRMDALQKSVLATVEAAARDDEDPRDTFARVKSLAWQAAGRPPLALPPPAPSKPPKVRAPRLAEAWFC